MHPEFFQKSQWALGMFFMLIWCVFSKTSQSSFLVPSSNSYLIIRSNRVNLGKSWQKLELGLICRTNTNSLIGLMFRIRGSTCDEIIIMSWVPMPAVTFKSSTNSLYEMILICCQKEKEMILICLHFVSVPAMIMNLCHGLPCCRSRFRGGGLC